MVQTRPYDEHMNQGNFALIVVDYIRFDFHETGDFLYNLLLGYAINEKYVEKLSSQFGFDLTKSYRVGIIVVDRTYGIL